MDDTDPLVDPWPVFHAIEPPLLDQLHCDACAHPMPSGPAFTWHGYHYCADCLDTT